jgi:predicted membrane chloride channel (bestrophin family)
MHLSRAGNLNSDVWATWGMHGCVLQKLHSNILVSPFLFALTSLLVFSTFPALLTFNSIVFCKAPYTLAGVVGTALSFNSLPLGH